MDQHAQAPQQADTLPIPRWEFIALCAALMALNSLAIDIMLPALQQIGASLGVENENHRQYVIAAYILGFGGGQLFFGPISDRFGRRAPLVVGLVIYVAAASAAAIAPTFATLILCRVVQGIGAAATRVIAVSIVRDTFEGRRMAEVMSLIFMVFMAIPVVAPGIGQFIMLFASWHWIFITMAAGALIVSTWSLLRLPETLRPELRRPLTVSSVLGGFRIVLTNRVALCYAFASTFAFGAMFGFINSAQQIYVDVFKVGEMFPVIFAGIAGVLSFSSYLNSRLVGRIGMRRLSQSALLLFLAISLAWLVVSIQMKMPLWLFISFFACTMVPFGALGANFNALAMEPLGQLAGTASSILGFMQTFLGGVLGTLIGQAFNGTVTPLAAGFCSVSLGALVMVLIAERGKFFQPQNPPV
ncbi:multidrug effflux MFS transporter [Mesorhizobium sp.]|uniref:multidrug effflux MFS transporter n=1 Tax=unclassified Mesorhizobium TaxID=325217 RepID=UPI000FE73CE5|nr:MAG: Bcr/CflA family efflux MFS transporter [Mesorhizobium sp.]RWK49722.1 MAG: Bcr/CflA family efflux MFS transporter [Mesorhizobium sp.]RWK92180.1 MAG: Bcr/CflA family efflux MFS transporter [Mesorhizobium sp.]RWL01532.1 MAG: Bcr/CflA family efflux MFS transporter [Mesorhizobium sp.]TIQ19551.1 MAG: multidrug effflux MFS transporter [Mesorhizobium sp.]